MLLSLEHSLTEFLKFLQISFWVTLPLLLLAVSVTIFNHYRRKWRREARRDKEAGARVFTPRPPGVPTDPVLPPSALPAGEPHNMRLILEKLSYSNARYIALNRDFESLREKYSSLLVSDKKIKEEPSKKTSMENLYQEVQATLQEQINEMKARHEREKTELSMRLQELSGTYQNLEKENALLREQLAGGMAGKTDPEITNNGLQWEEERKVLQERLEEQDYVKEVLGEKRKEIEFLQQQLEQRIKNHYQLDQQFRELSSRFTTVSEEMERRTENDRELQSTLTAKDQELLLLQDNIRSQTIHIGHLETTVNGLQDQQLELTNTLTGKEQTITDLKMELMSSREQLKQTEERLNQYNQLFRTFYNDISGLLGEERNQSPVILMKPMYETAEEELGG